MLDKFRIFLLLYCIAHHLSPDVCLKHFNFSLTLLKEWCKHSCHF
jgi:hypothetical protein